LANYRFEHTIFLFGLCLLPLVAVAFMMLLRWKQKSKQKIGDPLLINALTTNYAPLKFGFKFLLAAASLAIIIVGSANLQKPGNTDNINRKGIDVMIALDVSNSMLATDEKPNRLEKAKQLISKLIDKMPQSRVGLVLFAGRAYLQMPLTHDVTAAKMYVQNAAPEIVPTQGTVIAEALKIAVSAFNSKDGKYKSIVLISDGEDHDAAAVGMTTSLAQNGVIINSVGIGSTEGVTLIDPSTQAIKKDLQGNTVVTKLNEGILQELSKNTKGLYTRLEDPNNAAENIVAKLATVQQGGSSDKSLSNYQSYFAWFLAAALLLLLIEFFISERKTKNN
jgi:Ca-activated chloride channel homolog